MADTLSLPLDGIYNATYGYGEAGYCLPSWQTLAHWTEAQCDMKFPPLAFACLVAPLAAVASLSTPSPGSVGSDITLLYYNDIDGM